MHWPATTAPFLSVLSLTLAIPAPIPKPSPAGTNILKRSIIDAYTKVFSSLKDTVGVSKRQLGSSARSDFEQGRCADAIIIYSRGTTESGNIGTELSGPMIDQLDLRLRGRYNFQGVNNVVGGIVLFGDPNQGDKLPGALNNNVLMICNIGDLIFLGLLVRIATHLKYAADAP
ncbi:hypothetical protein BDZ91DRAFT_800667 [Kalaharituber pfeilii]|nr:hypothetical protein BDZ91DRAFT_800667 [Kalaharituber pfeilii]